jgi:putative selenate reductase
VADLVPFPFGRLVARMFRELERDRCIFDLPERKFVRGVAGKDISVSFHGRRASSPLAPAAGPHTQLAQNIVLSFLGGARIFELKTVQVLDALRIPRPCIDVQTIGYNVEWSQELTLEQSLEEYVKASMLIEMLVASGALGLEPGFRDFVFDMSVGYDLAGISGDRVQAFVRGMLDARPIVDRLRAAIPDEHARFRDLDFRTRISDTLTLSTFHGCPPDEIERITAFLMERVGLHCIVKLNPTLLGKTEVRRILNEVLGYDDRVPDEAFDKDARWAQAVEFLGRLGDKARELGRGFGIKLTNTLVVDNHRSFFPPAEKQMYLSGQPLHVLAMSLLGRFRAELGDCYPVSFSAGIDRTNFGDAVSLGLVPVSVCTDLLRTGGYGRMQAYFQELGKRMDAVGARDVDELVLLGQGQASLALDGAGASAGALVACRDALEHRGDLRAAAGPELLARWLSQARVRGTRCYVERLVADPRYRREATNRPPKKVGSRLVLFDCLTCDKCLPVCPNNANFTYVLPQTEVPIIKASPLPGGGFSLSAMGALAIRKKHQIATFADFCNECGNCDVFCPEDGGPYVMKAQFFGSRAHWLDSKHRDGFFLERRGSTTVVCGRFAGKEMTATFEDGVARLTGDGFEVTCAETDPTQGLAGRAEGEIDLTYVSLMSLLWRALLGTEAIHYVAG